MESVFLFFLMMLLLLGLGLVIFKYRADFKRWLHDPKYGSSWHISRETYLKRQIEDAEAELEWLEEDDR